MIYVLDHYYAIDHQEYCIVVESEKNVDEIIEICSAVAFLLEDTVDVSACLDMNCLLKILITYYGGKDKKVELNKEELRQVQMPIEGVCEEIFLPHNSISVSKAYIVDLYGARESCCGERYKQVMERWLPEGERLEELKALLVREGVEQ